MLFSGKNLLKHFIEVRNFQLPVSLSALNKDRLDGRLGIPFTPLGGKALYDPDLVQGWVDGLPVVIPSRATTQSKPVQKRGKPLKAETVLAARLGISVPQLRAQGGAK